MELRHSDREPYLGMRVFARPAWMIVAGISVVSSVVLGTTISTLGIFLSPLIDSFNCTNEQAARAPMAFVLSMTVTMPIVGWLLDRVGAKIVMICGILMIFFGHVLASETNSIEMFVFAMAVSGAGAGSATYVPGTYLISELIHDRPALAIGIMQGMASLGSAFFPVVLVELLDEFGWRFSMLLIAFFVLVVCMPILALLIKARPKKYTNGNDHEKLALQGMGVKQGVFNSTYWLLALIQMLAGFGFMGIFFYIVPYLMSVGFSMKLSTGLFSVTNITSFIGYIGFGFLADKLGVKWSLLIGLIVCSLGGSQILLADNLNFGLAALIAFAILWGGTCAISTQFIPLLLVELVGLKNFGSLFGVNYLLYGLAAAASPIAMGVIYDETNSYRMAFQLCVLLVGLSVVPIFFIKIGGIRDKLRI